MPACSRRPPARRAAPPPTTARRARPPAAAPPAPARAPAAHAKLFKYQISPHPRWPPAASLPAQAQANMEIANARCRVQGFEMQAGPTQSSDTSSIATVSEHSRAPTAYGFARPEQHPRRLQPPQAGASPSLPATCSHNTQDLNLNLSQPRAHQAEGGHDAGLQLRVVGVLAAHGVPVGHAKQRARDGHHAQRACHRADTAACDRRALISCANVSNAQGSPNMYR